MARLRATLAFTLCVLKQIFDSGPLPFEQVRDSILAEVQIQKADTLFETRSRETFFSVIFGIEHR